MPIVVGFQKLFLSYQYMTRRLMRQAPGASAMMDAVYKIPGGILVTKWD